MARKKTEGNGVRDDKGRFVKGSPGGPGRPPGSLNLLTICRQKAEAEGVDLESVLWSAIKAMAKRAIKGDHQTAKILFERLAGPVRQEHDITSATTVHHAGPPEPDGTDLEDYIRKMIEIAGDEGIVPERNGKGRRS